MLDLPTCGILPCAIFFFFMTESIQLTSYNLLIITVAVCIRVLKDPSREILSTRKDLNEGFRIINTSHFPDNNNIIDTRKPDENMGRSPDSSENVKGFGRANDRMPRSLARFVRHAPLRFIDMDPACPI
jgi:hypothetical protein